MFYQRQESWAKGNYVGRFEIQPGIWMGITSRPSASKFCYNVYWPTTLYWTMGITSFIVTYCEDGSWKKNHYMFYNWLDIGSWLLLCMFYPADNISYYCSQQLSLNHVWIMTIPCFFQATHLDQLQISIFQKNHSGITNLIEVFQLKLTSCRTFSCCGKLFLKVDSLGKYCPTLAQKIFFWQLQ